MLIKVYGPHAPYASKLQAFLGTGHEVVPVAAFPPTGEIACDVLVAARFSADEGRRLKARLLHVPGAGTDAVPLEVLPAGMRICNVFEHEIPIAEYVTHAVLDYCIYSAQSRFDISPEHWADTYRGRAFHDEAFGQRAVIVGFGSIGKAVARRLGALGMQVVAVTRSGKAEPLANETHPVAVLDTVLPDCDVVVLCVPLGDATRHLISQAQLRAMRPDALLVNVSRAQVIDEAALFQALSKRQIGRAVLDVWYRYPSGSDIRCAASDFPFHTLDNVVATAHISGWTHGLIDRRYRIVADNIARLQAGQPLVNVVR